MKKVFVYILRKNGNISVKINSLIWNELQKTIDAHAIYLSEKLEKMKTIEKVLNRNWFASIKKFEFVLELKKIKWIF